MRNKIGQIIPQYEYTWEKDPKPDHRWSRDPRLDHPALAVFQWPHWDVGKGGVVKVIVQFDTGEQETFRIKPE